MKEMRMRLTRANQYLLRYGGGTYLVSTFSAESEGQLGFACSLALTTNHPSGERASNHAANLLPFHQLPWLPYTKT